MKASSGKRIPSLNRFQAKVIGGKRFQFRARISPAMAEPRSVVVYSRKGCHLCEVVKESLTKLSRRGGFTWRDIDVDTDADLRRQFNDEVPVVFIDGRKAFKYRMDEQEFLKKLAN
jgi:glutaredoxin